jgi:hypothetical protein
VALGEGRSAELNIAFDRVIRGLVMDAGSDQPLAADERLEFAARRTGEPENRDYVSADAGGGGRFTMYVTEPALYEVRLLPSGSWFMESSAVADLRTASEVEVRLRVRRDPKNGRITLRIVDDVTGERVEYGDYRSHSQGSSGVGAFMDAMIESTECAMGIHRFVVQSDIHAPVLVEVAITQWVKTIDREVRLPRGDSVLVSDVTPGGNAWKAGLLPHDVITTYAGTPIRDLAELWTAIRNAPKDAPVRLTIRRGEEPLELSVSPGPLGMDGSTHRDER